MDAETDHNGEDHEKAPDTQPEFCAKLTSSNDDNIRQVITQPQSKKSAFYRHFLAKVLMKFSRRFIRGFTSGVLLYSGTKIVTTLLRNPFRITFHKIRQDILSKDCMRLAVFCALYPSIYHLLVETFAVLQNQKNGWTYGISGGVAGLSIAVLDKPRRQTLAFFTLSRALGAGLSTLVTRGHVPAVPYCEVGAFCACCSIVVYCMTLKPQYLNQGYYRSLTKWIRAYTDKRLQVFFRNPGSHFLSCQEVGLHKTPCSQYQLMDLLNSLPGYVKLYLPIYITPVILFKRELLRKKPLDVLQTFLKNMALSTMFMGTLVHLIKLTVCILHNMSHKPPPLPAYIPLIAGAVSGLALLLERYNRRKELLLFVIFQVLSVFYNMVNQSKLQTFLRLPHGITVIFALSMMCVMHAYEQEPASLTVFISGIMKIFVGARTSSTP